MCACVRVCVCACAHVHVRVRVRVRVVDIGPFLVLHKYITKIGNKYFPELKKGKPYFQCKTFFFINIYIEGDNIYSYLLQ